MSRNDQTAETPFGLFLDAIERERGKSEALAEALASAKSIPLTGRFRRCVDSKRRFTLPQHLAREITATSRGEVYMAVDAKRPCLLVLPAAYFAQRLEEDDSMAMLREAVRGHMRAANRLTMPQDAEVLLPDDYVLIVGAVTHLEVWDEETYEQQQDGQE